MILHNCRPQRGRYDVEVVRRNFASFINTFHKALAARKTDNSVQKQDLCSSSYLEKHAIAVLLKPEELMFSEKIPRMHHAEVNSSIGKMSCQLKMLIDFGFYLLSFLRALTSCPCELNIELCLNVYMHTVTVAEVVI